MTPEQIKTLREMRDDGITLRAIAAQFGCKETAIAWQVKKHNLPLKDLSVKDAKLFSKMYKDGKPVGEIADAVGINRKNVARTAGRLGLPKRALVRVCMPVPVAPPPKPKPPADPFPGVTGLDRELLMAGRSETKRAEVAARNGLTMTQARIKWFRLAQEYGG